MVMVLQVVRSKFCISRIELESQGLKKRQGMKNLMLMMRTLILTMSRIRRQKQAVSLLEDRDP